MEQYKFCSSNVQDDTVPRTLMDDKNIYERFKKNFKEENCFGGQKCSGFGKCSPVNTDVKEEGGLIIFIINYLQIYFNINKIKYNLI